LAGCRACRPVAGPDGRRARGVPAVPAFGGLFAEVIPHLTVGDRLPRGRARALRTAEAEVLSALPVRAHVSRAWLMTGTRTPGIAGGPRNDHGNDPVRWHY